MATQLTPTHKRMLALLSDGSRHSSKELHGCLSDELGPVRNILHHISTLRDVLRPKGQDILCERDGKDKDKTYYRHIRVIAPDDE